MRSYQLRILLICLWAFFFISPASFSQDKITISEVMFDPSGSDYYDEFVEIYNFGAVEIELTGWQISDGSGVDLLVAEQASQLQPGGFAIILDGGYAENSTGYDSLIPQNTLRLTISDNAFGSNGFSNSTPETIYLINAAGDTVSQYTYSLDNQPGFSDEKIELSGSNDPANWANSRVLFGTPGFNNSVAKSEIDLAIESNSITFFPEKPIAGEAITIFAQICNFGKQAVTAFTVYFYEDKNRDALPDRNEQLGFQYFSEMLAPGDSTEASYSWENVSPGERLILIEIDCPDDANFSNNLGKASITVDYAALDIIVNEIMYRPAAGSPEWVEIYNRGEASFDLKRWSLSDSRETSRVRITGNSTIIAPGEFVIIAEDSTIASFFPATNCQILVPSKGFPALNNDKDAVVLRSATGRSSDSVYYRSSWGGELGISLERKRYHAASDDPVNWGSSLNSAGGTPGAKNTLCPLDFDLAIDEASLQITPALPNTGENVQLSIIIQNKGIQPVSGFRIDLFDDANRDSIGQEAEKIDSFEQLESLAPEAEQSVMLSWSNITAGRHYVLLNLEYNEDQKKSNNAIHFELIVRFPPNSLVINEIMYCPRAGEPEWVELFNPTPNAVDVNGWRISDSKVTDCSRFASSRLLIPPGGYVIVAADTNLGQRYAALDVLILRTETAFPTLNNDDDAVVITDLTGSCIDSAAYSSKWDSEIGVSLERVLPERSSTDSTNWRLSEAVQGATPGQINSIYPRKTDLAILAGSLAFKPEVLQFGEADTLCFEVKNIGLREVFGFTVRLYDNARFDSVAGQSVEEFEIDKTLQPDSTITIETTWYPQNSGIRNILTEVFYEADLDPQNNRVYKTLRVGFPAEIIVINEIMHSPPEDACEWVELYNKSEQPVDLAEWAISDLSTQKAVRLTSESFWVEPGEFIIITEDSSVVTDYGISASLVILPEKSFPGLNDDDESVILFDPAGTKIDSVWYSNAMGGTGGFSLERFNPEITGLDRTNWHSSVSPRGGTPGETNSIYLPEEPTFTELSISPNPFSPNGDGIEDIAGIHYHLPVKTARINLKIYDVRGRLIRTIFSNQPVAANGSTFWDGADNDGRIARVGIYIVYLEALNDEAGILKSLREVVVLARHL